MQGCRARRILCREQTAEIKAGKTGTTVSPAAPVYLRQAAEKSRKMKKPGVPLTLFISRFRKHRPPAAHGERTLPGQTQRGGTKMKTLMRTLALTMILMTMISSASAAWVPHQTVRRPRTQTAVGDTIRMGRFEQDDNFGNGDEAIEWLVLDVRDGKALVISKYSLITSYYGKSYAWETSEIRRWLNGTFLNQAFSARELAAIKTTAVDNSGAQHYSGYSVPGTSTTMDKLFLLSYAEARSYYGVIVEGKATSGNVKARASFTAYARAKDPISAAVSSDQRTAEGKTAGKWWLRSPGARNDCAIYITPEGTVGYNYTNTWRNLVRPAMWVDLALLPRT